VLGTVAAESATVVILISSPEKHLQHCFPKGLPATVVASYRPYSAGAPNGVLGIGSAGDALPIGRSP
jgi:hypothetical protein